VGTRRCNSFGGVRLGGPKSFRRAVTATATLDADHIERLARILVTALPSK
jgi:hypothetical protein